MGRGKGSRRWVPHARGARPCSAWAQRPQRLPTRRPALQISDEYSSLKGFTPRETGGNRGGPGEPSGKAAAAAAADSKSATARLIDSIPVTRPGEAAAARAGKGKELVLHTGKEGITAAAKAALTSTIMVPTAAGGQKEYTPSAAIARKIPNKWPRPSWHAPWKMYRAIAGHLG